VTIEQRLNFLKSFYLKVQHPNHPTEIDLTVYGGSAHNSDVPLPFSLVWSILRTALFKKKFIFTYVLWILQQI